MPRATKEIIISRSTYNKLTAHRTPGENLDDVLFRLITFFEEMNTSIYKTREKIAKGRPNR